MKNQILAIMAILISTQAWASSRPLKFSPNEREIWAAELTDYSDLVDREACRAFVKGVTNIEQQDVTLAVTYVLDADRRLKGTAALEWGSGIAPVFHVAKLDINYSRTQSQYRMILGQKNSRNGQLTVAIAGINDRNRVIQEIKDGNTARVTLMKNSAQFGESIVDTVDFKLRESTAAVNAAANCPL